MAIAPLPEQMEMELLEIPWPSSASLRSVDALVEVPSQPIATIHQLRPVPAPAARRVPVSRATVVRRRRVVLALGVLALVVALALPLRALGAVTVSGQQTPGGMPSGLADGTPYVAQPGDTLTSIAQRIDPGGNQAALVSELRHEVGSSAIVPGERIQLP